MSDRSERPDSNPFAARRDRFRSLLQTKGIDAALVSHAANRFYLSGFELHDGQANESSGRLVIGADGRDWLATDSRYEETAAKIWPKDNILVYRGEPEREIVGLLRKLGVRIGIETKILSWNSVGELRKYGGEDLRLMPSDGLVESLRAIKDDFEIDALKKSFRLNHAAFAWLEKEILAGGFYGITERELSWEIERFFRENGASELAFSNIVAIAQNGASPHAIPGDNPIIKNSPLLIDIGCRVDNYCSDQTRVFWLGDSPSREFSRALELVLKAQQTAMDIMRPGLPCKDAYQAAFEVFRTAGVEKEFTHGLGHGVGLETHEAPSLSPRSENILQKGMTVTVEPGLYYPAWGGIRWEYTTLVEDSGAMIL